MWKSRIVNNMGDLQIIEVHGNDGIENTEV